MQLFPLVEKQKLDIPRYKGLELLGRARSRTKIPGPNGRSSKFLFRHAIAYFSLMNSIWVKLLGAFAFSARSLILASHHSRFRSNYLLNAPVQVLQLKAEVEAKAKQALEIFQLSLKQKLLGDFNNTARASLNSISWKI